MKKGAPKRSDASAEDNTVNRNVKKTRVEEEVRDDSDSDHEELQPFGDLVDEMMEMEDFFRLSMEENSDLYRYLKKAPRDLAKILEISKTIRSLLGGEEMDDYLLAFTHMMNSHGYSMLQFMKNHQGLARYLEIHLKDLMQININYLRYTIELEKQRQEFEPDSDSVSTPESLDNVDNFLFWQLPIDSSAIGRRLDQPIEEEIDFPTELDRGVSNKLSGK